jgi:hypothetical protein
VAALAAALLACGGAPKNDAPWLTMPDRTQHAAMFVLVGTSHATTDCNACHTGQAFQAFDCTQCHGKARCDAAHGTAVPAYRFANPSCVDCHKDGALVGVDHAAIFPIGAGTSHDLACADCHGDAARRGDPATLACGACHDARPGFAAAHAAVKDFSPAGAACVRCHAEPPVARLTAHQPRFPVAAGSLTHDTACLHCHVSSRADKSWAADFKAFDCTRCHAQAATDPGHAAVTGYAWTATACYGCHKDGTAAVVDHARFFPIGAGTSHALACADCHGDPANRADPATLKCAACHATRPGFPTRHAAVKDFAAQSAACVRCHADPPVDLISAHQARFPIAAGSVTHDTGCLHCHTASQAAKPWATDFAKFDCTACHTRAATDPNHVGVTGYAFSSAGCFSCHPGGTAGAPANHPQLFPIAAGTSHAGIACSACHTDPANRASTATLACSSCHRTRDPNLATKHSGATIPVTDYATTSPACLKCHWDGRAFDTASHPIGSDTPAGNRNHRNAGCTRCHSGTRADKPYTAVNWGTEPGCRTCHANGVP